MSKPSTPLPCRSAIAVLLALAMLAGCKRAETDATPQAAPAPAAAAQPPAASPENNAAPLDAGAAQGLPAGFTEYASTAFGDGRLCVVGASSSDSDPAQIPYVAVKQAGDGRVLWSRALSGIEGMYQTRATHCVDAGGSLQVLLQSDTHSQQSLSQTQLSVARVAVDGSQAVSRYVEVPGTRDRAYSAWVEPGAGNFGVRDGQLLVRGHYRFNEEPEVQHDFEVAPDME